MMIKKKKVNSLIIAVSLMSGCFFTGNTISAETNFSSDGSMPYIAYEQQTDQNFQIYDSGADISLNTLNPIEQSENTIIRDNFHELGEAAIVIPDNGYAEWSFTAESDCAKILRIKYAAAKTSSGNLELELELDGKTPFKESNLISMRRTFTQGGGKFESNVSGNDILPATVEKLCWNEYDVSDSSGYAQDAFVFMLKKGEHRLRLTGSRGETAFGAIDFISAETVLTYSEYKNKYSNEKSALAQSLILEGEAFATKNASTILPKIDHTSPATSPQSPYALKYNTVGANSWKTIGDSITWEFSIEKAGSYEIAVRFRQNLADGIFASRKLYIDGKLPFSEAASLRFEYNQNWQCKKLGDDKEDYKFWLSEGKHTITLETVAGDVRDIVSQVDITLNSLNRIYRRIVKVTGNSPDVNRDYKFNELIPNELKEMEELAKVLKKCIADIKLKAGDSGSYTSILEKLVFQIEKMTDNPRKIAANLDIFKSNLGSLSSWLLSAVEQPLEIDRIYIQPELSNLPKADAGFFGRVNFSVKCFIASYVNDYNSIGQTSDENESSKKQLEVWIQTGRDQGEIIRDLMSSSFTKENNVTINLKIVPVGTLLQSVIAGISPDVVFDCTTTEPVDYALRGAVADLTQFDDYEEYFKRFPEAAVLPARLNNGVYAMPQTFGFNMLFYRTDIFEEYGWKVPETWAELKTLIPSLQYNGMEIGIPHDTAMYAMLLYQNGGKLYKENGKYTNLKTNTCLESFVDFCEFFTLYDSPATFDFANRFRSGEMPLAIQNYTIYNQLIAFAPEIKGLWKMIPVPGTKDSNGNINNVSVGTSTFMMILENSKIKQTAWEFIKWFMSDDTQISYAMRMESLLGNCAKVNTANAHALAGMAWSSSEYSGLSAQLCNVDAVPQVPGGYYLDRVINFAFNRTYNGSSEQTMGEDPAEVLTQYIKEFNDELEHKRNEFSEVLQNEK